MKRELTLQFRKNIQPPRVDRSDDVRQKRVQLEAREGLDWRGGPLVGGKFTLANLRRE